MNQKTRNSVIADKPRNAFVHIGIKHVPYHMYYNVEFDRSTSKGVGIHRGKLLKLGSAGAPPLWDGGVADPL